jgi:cytochrome c553
MRKVQFLLLLSLASALIARAQIVSPSNDVLGAHLNYGRGCTACHAPHSGSYSGGTSGSAMTSSSSAGRVALWGDDVSGLYGKTLTTDGGKFTEVLPASLSANTPDVAGILTCLGCHDGNYATNAMMKNKVYESLPATYGTAAVPTLIGNSAMAGSYLSEHPLGLKAALSCGGTHWDCTNSGGIISMRGAASSHFVSNYGFFVKPAAYNGSAVITCVTCHDEHSMNVVRITNGSTSGLPTGYYATMFFLRAPYNPASGNPNSNQTSQFCRQCHGDKSNEMNGSSAGTVF